MQLSRADIAEMIPHAGPMCLLDGVVRWDAATIRCITRTHGDPANAMRTDDGLSALCGIEYAAQAMAIHGCLTGAVDGRPRAGYLAGLRDVLCHRERLDDIDGELFVDAELLMGDESRVVYRFALLEGGSEVISGRATVILSVEADET
jgi:predicted hotdog family 3-hydroxylacyl-ACP dehydratase